MREIKFRAWDKEYKEMRSFESLCDGDFDSWPSLYYALTDDRYYIPMQYTGLKDKNGKEIFEGDILSFGGDQNVSIEWNQPSGSWCLSFNMDGEPYLDSFMDGENAEVIGNLYEHPDLLK